MFLRICLLLTTILIIASCKNNKQHTDNNEVETIQIFESPIIVYQSNLPDSSRPKSIIVKDMPNARSITIPTNELDYSYINSNNKKIDLTLTPPTITPTAVLTDNKGVPISDSLGNNFTMGNGGISHFTNFTTNDGLALDGISCSVMDNEGNIWFGTQGGGVSKYDGYTFTTYTTAHGLANNSVMSLAADSKGNIWFGTNGGGLSKFDGHNFRTFTTNDNLANNSIYSMTEDSKGNMWFGSYGGGVSKYDGKKFKTISTKDGLADDFIMAIKEDSKGNVWFGTNGKGLSKYDGKKFETFTKDDGLASDWIRSITEDSKGNLWLGTYGGGASKYDGKDFTNYSTESGLASKLVMSIVEAKDGKLWFGTNGYGVSSFDGKKFKSFSTKQGLTNDRVWTITKDKGNNLWFGTFGGGVSRFECEAFTKFDESIGLANSTVFCINEDKKGNMWFGTNGGGVSKYDGKEFTNYSSKQGIADRVIMAIEEDSQGLLWFGTNGGGVTSFDGKAFTSYSTTQGLPSNQIFAIREDNDKNLWFGTYEGGVVKYDGRSFTNYTTSQGLANNSVWSIFKDSQGNMWFGTLGGGVSRFDGKSFITLTTKQGLSDDNVYSISEDAKGNIWIGTANGLNLIYTNHLENNSEEPLIKIFTTTDGLADNLVTQVLKLSNDRLAIGTNLGITIFNTSDDYSKLENIEIYNTNTDFPVKDVNAGQNGMFLDKNGILWAGTGNEETALVRFDMGELNKSTEAPNIVLKNVKVNDNPIIWNSLRNKPISDSTITPAYITEEITALGKELTVEIRDSLTTKFKNIEFDSVSPFYYIPYNLVLPYKNNHLTIDYGAIETGKPNQVKYKHFLVGYEEDWSPVSHKTSSNFGNIGEGEYEFKVMAQGLNGVWSEPISYTFEVLPPWYRTWWAYAIYVLLAIIVIYGFVRWRLAKLEKEKEILEETVKIRTAEVVEEKKEADRQRERSDSLLLNILPAEIAEELKEKGSSDAKEFDLVTILFTDFKGFTQASEKLTAKELVEEIDTCFKYFDSICGKYNIEKIKTIGDAYMAAGGLPVPFEGSVKNTILAALEMSEFIKVRKIQKEREGKIPFEMRLGLHTGPVVAGIVGIKKFAYDIWGDTVNTASRMESSGAPGQINISQVTYEIVKDDPDFRFTSRGKIQAKGKGEMEMFFVELVNR